MESRYEVPLPYLDLTPAETYSQLLDSLEKLDEAAQSMFRNITSRVRDDRGACRVRLLLWVTISGEACGVHSHASLSLRRAPTSAQPENGGCETKNRRCRCQATEGDFTSHAASPQCCFMNVRILMAF